MTPFKLSELPLRHYQDASWDSARWQGFEPRQGDILVCTPYKAGTTWMQMICALLIFQRTELHKPLAEISPWMEIRGHEAAKVHATYAAQSHRRFIKTHTALDGLPWYPQSSYICVQRDPRDVFMSLLNHLRNWNPQSEAIFAREMRAAGRTKPDVPDDPNAFFRQWLTTGNFEWEEDGAPYWSVFRHGLTFWTHRDQPNLLLVHYADLQRDLDREMRRIADFLGIDVPEARWPDLVDAARFDSMKKNADRIAPDTDMKMWKDNTQFFNKGTSGQWRGVLDQESLSLLETVKARYPEDYFDWLFNGSGAPAQ